MFDLEPSNLKPLVSAQKTVNARSYLERAPHSGVRTLLYLPHRH
jgi:hypothetical protein